jgi:DNA-binding NarL/FixJ family response regulator
MMTGTADDESFSADEAQLARLLVQGATKEAIARRFEIAPVETDARVKHLLQKIGARDRKELLARLSKLR